MKARRLPTNRRASAALLAKRSDAVAEWRRRTTKKFILPRPPCAYLSSATGQLLKISCRKSNAKVAEHFCVHPQRRRHSQRQGKLVDGRCTPLGRCSDWEIGIQPCQSCPLRSPRLLLVAPS